MTRLAARVKRLGERAGGTICPMCGNGSGAPVVFTINTTLATEQNVPPKHCPRCGAVSWFTIQIDRREGA